MADSQLIEPCLMLGFLGIPRVIQRKSYNEKDSFPSRLALRSIDATKYNVKLNLICMSVSCSADAVVSYARDCLD
jgi:hypothetical protein